MMTSQMSNSFVSTDNKQSTRIECVQCLNTFKHTFHMFLTTHQKCQCDYMKKKKLFFFSLAQSQDDIKTKFDLIKNNMTEHIVYRIWLSDFVCKTLE